MNIKPVDNIKFGIYKGTHKTYYGNVDRGIYKDKIIDIYTALNPDNTLKHKLYYVSNTIGGWIKSKLKFFKNNKCYYTAFGLSKELNNTHNKKGN